MNTAEIIKQQLKIEADKKASEQKLACNAIKQWVENNVQNLAVELLERISKRFLSGFKLVRYRCVIGSHNYPLGHDYPESIGTRWKVEYYKEYREDEYTVVFADRFFKKNPTINRNNYTEGVCELYISHMLFHTKLPQLLMEEGFNVKHNGCGCCEQIDVSL